jgi:cytochrome c5
MLPINPGRLEPFWYHPETRFVHSSQEVLMKRRVLMVVAAGGLLVMGSGTQAQAQGPGLASLEGLAKAKQVFEQTCGVCHGLERPLSKTFDRAGWEKTVERMHDNGAEASAEERALVVSYLLAKNTFEARCSVCHGLDRPLGKSKSAGDWIMTVQRMAEKKPGLLTAAEAADVAAYLALTRPAQQ